MRYCFCVDYDCNLDEELKARLLMLLEKLRLSGQLKSLLQDAQTPEKNPYLDSGFLSDVLQNYEGMKTNFPEFYKVFSAAPTYNYMPTHFINMYLQKHLPARVSSDLSENVKMQLYYSPIIWNLLKHITIRHSKYFKYSTYTAHYCIYAFCSYIVRYEIVYLFT